MLLKSTTKILQRRISVLGERTRLSNKGPELYKVQIIILIITRGVNGHAVTGF